MNHLDEAKLLSALLGVLKKENSKVRKDILEELRTELQKGIEDQSGVKYLRLDEVEDFQGTVPIQVFKGDQGKEGPRGLKGTKGDKGDTGAQGERGRTGPQGERGKIGPIGPQGSQGLIGPLGPAGKDGIDGQDGATPDVKPIEDRLTRLFEDFKGSVSAQVTRMAYAKGGGSSGSGEVRLLRLDDVDVSNLSAGKSLRYNANTAKLEFFAPFDPQNSGDIIPAANNVYNLGSPERQWESLYLSGGTIFINGQAAVQTDNDSGNIVLASNTLIRTDAGGLSPIVSQSILDSYMQVANVTAFVTSTFNNLVDGAPAALDTLNELAAAIADDENFAVSITTGLNSKASNTYVNSALSLKADAVDLNQYLQVANSFSGVYNDLTSKPNLDQYLQVSNTLSISVDYNNVVNAPNLDVYASNTALSLKADATALNNYLQVANASVFTTQVDLDNYLQVANNFSGAYSDLTGAPNLDAYASNTALALKADSTDLAQYVQVANVNSLIQTSVNNLIDGAPGALDTLNELAAALGDDADFVTTITSSIDSKADATLLSQYLQVANSFSGSYDDLTDTPNLNIYAANSSVNSALSLKANISDLDQYLQVANASSVTPDQLDQYLQVANSASFATQTNLNQYLQVANTLSISVDYNNVINTPDLDVYASNSALALKADSVVLNNYLQVSNSTSFITSTALSPYLQAANATNFITNNALTPYLQVANASIFTTQIDLNDYLQVANSFSGSYDDLFDKPNLNQYLQVANASSITPDQLDQYLQVANSFSESYNDLTDKPNLNQYLQVSNTLSISVDYNNIVNTPNLDIYASNSALALKADATDLNQYLQVANTFSGVYNDLTSKPNLDVYASNNALQLKADASDLTDYLQVANSFSKSYNDLTDKPNLDVYASNSALVLKADAVDLNQYLQVANSFNGVYNDLTGKPNLDQYLQVSNTLSISVDYNNVVNAPNLDVYAANSALALKADTADLSDYLQVANAAFISGNYNELSNKPNLDIYAANSALSLKANTADLNQYVQVANNFSGVYSDLTSKPNLDVYASNSSVTSSLALKANTSDLNQYVQVANVNSLIQTSVNNLIDGAPGALDTLNELAAALGDDANFVNTITSSIDSKADATLLSQYLQVANTFSGSYNDLTDAPNLDVYAANSALSLKADSTDLDQYLQVANSFSGSYNDLTNTPNLNTYAANSFVVTQLGLKANTTQINNYLQVANSTAFVSTANTVGQGTSLVESKINNIINFRSLRAGSNISLSENNGDIVISATGELSVADSIDFGFVNNDFGSIVEAADSDPQYDFGTI